MHLFLLGLLLGFGAAVPIGPMNVEITRRNLRFGTRYGLSFGLGACSADLVYLILIALGALVLLQHPLVLRAVGLTGALILTWFGINAIRLKAIKAKNDQSVPPSLFKNYSQGLMLTLLNPITIIFWGSVSSHIVISADQHLTSIFLAGLGVAIATISWASGLNLVLHLTKHKLSDSFIHRINVLGGVILLLFAMMGFYQGLLG
jgi:L-lysine exporter family protein LysE/ArgO